MAKIKAGTTKNRGTTAKAKAKAKAISVTPTTSPKPRPATRDKILTAATTLFARQGYNHTTISQIAKKAKVSEASIYEYFSGKEEVLLEIPVRGIRENYLPRVEQSLFGIKGAFNQLRKFLWDYCRELICDTDYASVIFLELKTNKNFIQTEAYHDVQLFYRKLVTIIEAGQEAGEIKPHLNPHHARMVILGAFEHMIIRWLLKDYAYDLFEQLEEVFDIIEDGLRAEPRRAG
ncbi:MAG: TetR/AcrR family transcriptional regulator [Proteobacteria bacterium]|nr:TetR/AcrR family transcriptional regulator [Pseudomonadota bacterium]